MILTGCSSEQIKETTYNALRDKDCMKTQGYPNCHADGPGYTEYKKQREEAVN